MSMEKAVRALLALVKGQETFFLPFFVVIFLLAGPLPPTNVAHGGTEVTSTIQVNYSNPRYDRRNKITSYHVTLTNTGEETVSVPLKVIIDSISSDQVTVANPDGTTQDGKPYFDYSSLLGDDVLDPQETSGEKVWQFNNPSRARFSLQVRIVSGAQEVSPPSIMITNPVNNGVISDATPLITIRFSDPDSGIDTDSLDVEINGSNATSLFDVTPTGASCQYNIGLPEGANEISATISNTHGISSSISVTFNVASSTAENKYIFSLENNPWLFISPGDGTYSEYLTPGQLGADAEKDLISLAVNRFGNFYFTQPGHSQVFESMGTGTSSQYLTYGQIGLSDADLDALYISLDGNIFFSLSDHQDIFLSSGDGSYSTFATNSDLGAGNKEISALHVGYDGTIYYGCSALSPGQGTEIYESTGDGNSSLFLTSTDLGVQGANIDAFAMVPDTVPPEIHITSPMDGAFVNTRQPTISITFLDEYSGIDISSFSLQINGSDYTSQCSVTTTGAVCHLTSDLSVGSNTAIAQVSDLAGNQASDTITFRIGVLRAIPGANPTSGPAPLTVHFTTDGEDPAGTIEVFRWDFDGDGNWDTYDTVARDYNHTYTQAGTYNATLYVQSSTGRTATASITITVQNNPPTATADVQPSNGAVPLTVQMIGSGSDVDGHIVLYEWDFDGDGTYDWSSTTTGNTSHTYTEVGTFNAVFRVTDNEGATATAVAMTSVVSVGPEGSPTAQGSAAPDNGPAPLTVQFTGTGTDPDGTIVRYEWDFENDGIYDWSSDSSGATTHTYSTPGTYIAAFKVTDNSGDTGIDYVLIDVGIQVSLGLTDPDKTFNPYSNETMGIVASINAPVPASVVIRNADGQTVKTLPVDIASQPVPLFVDNMENGENGWTHDGSNDLWQLGSPTSGPGAARSGSNNWGTNLSGRYSNYMNCWLLSPPIDITEPCELTFYQYFQSESYYDGGIVEVTTDGNTFTRLAPVGGYPYHNVSFGGNAYSGSLGGWSKQAFDLSPFVGQNIQIRFRFISDSSVTYQGWYIDDVRIAQNPGVVYWDGKDDNNIPVPDGIYHAILRYQFNGSWHEYDLSNTGGQRFVPSRQSTGGSSYHPALSRPFEDQFLPIHFSLNRASEVTLFVGILWNTNTRIRTIYNRVPMPAGQHTVYWDGLDDTGNIAQPPPGNALILGIWGYTMPDNAMYVTGGRPVISNVAATPNYFCPFSEKCDAEGNDEGIILSYHLSENAVSVELRVYSIETGYLVRTEVINNVSAGDNAFFWDGKNNNGEYVDMGDYRIGLIATDNEGNKSMLSYTLVRINY